MPESLDTGVDGISEITGKYVRVPPMLAICAPANVVHRAKCVMFCDVLWVHAQGDSIYGSAHKFEELPLSPELLKVGVLRGWVVCCVYGSD